MKPVIGNFKGDLWRERFDAFSVVSRTGIIGVNAVSGVSGLAAFWVSAVSETPSTMKEFAAGVLLSGLSALNMEHAYMTLSKGLGSGGVRLAVGLAAVNFVAAGTAHFFGSYDIRPIVRDIGNVETVLGLVNGTLITLDLLLSRAARK